MRVLLWALAVLSAALASAAPAAPRVLEPTSPWDLDYAANTCRLIRMFGSGKDAVKLVFEQLVPRGPMTVILIGNVPADSDDNILGFESLPGVTIGKGQSLETVDSSGKVVFWPRRLGRGRWGLIPEAEADRMAKADPVAEEESQSTPAGLSPPPKSWKDRDWKVQSSEEWKSEDAAFGQRADKVTAVVLNPGRSGSVSFHTGGLAKPFEALEDCASDSLKDWGIDPAVEASIVTGAHPVEEPGRLFGPGDYPMAALRNFKQDNLEVWLNIDAQGQIASCRVISDFASPEINDAICAMVRRKERFVPARTKEGTAVPDFYTQSFVFKLQ